MTRDLKAEARQIFQAGLRAVDPKESVKRFVLLEKNRLRVGELEFDLGDFDTIMAIGAGKASAAMARGVEEVLGDRLSGGLVIVKYGYVTPLEKIRLVEGGGDRQHGALLPDGNELHVHREFGGRRRGCYSERGEFLPESGKLHVPRQLSE